MSNYADETNRPDAANPAEDEFAPAGVPTPGSDADEVNPETGPAGDIRDEGMETPIAPSGR